MNVYRIDPIHDSRWSEFLSRHPKASVFDSPGWLKALQSVYGYDPLVLTTSPPGRELENGIPFCRVKSWLCGRLVSLPFSDHCEPLVDRPQELSEIMSSLVKEVQHDRWRYAELRPRISVPPGFGSMGGFQTETAYCFHAIDLAQKLEELFRHLHPSCVQRLVRRANRVELTYEEGKSESHLTKFYHLLQMTRQRQGIPPQPLTWFRTLIACLGSHLTIHVASKDAQPIASILTLSYKSTMVYKYGCSDARYHRLGGMPFLFWKTICKAKGLGMTEFDLGRSDTENTGLIAFKDRLGARRSTLVYYRYYGHPTRFSKGTRTLQVVRRVLKYMPAPALNAAGKTLYKYFG